MRQLLADLRFGLRLLAKSPGWSALIVATLALGVGANTAIFSIVDSVLLRPLDYPNSERLVRICSTHESVAGFCVASPPDVEDWARQSQTLENFGTARSWNLAVGGDEGTETLAGGLVSGRYLNAFGPAPAVGRLFERSDYLQGQRNVVILDHRFWMERFGGSTEVLGELLTIDDESFSVVGVLPSGFEVPELEHVKLWLPVPFDPADEKNRNWRGFQAIAMVAADHTRTEAQTELGVLAERLAREHPETNAGWGVRLQPLHDRVVGSVRSTLWLFLGAVSFVLLIACANVASLLLARSLTRRPELAVRAALGAGRRRLLSQLLTENLLLAGVGGALGFLLAHGLVRVFIGLAPADFPRLGQVAIDGGVLAFTVLASLGATLLFGLVPAMRASRLELRSGLVRGTGAVDPRSSRLGSGLVVAEVALALVLLIGAGLMLRSFVNTASWERALDHEHLLSMWLLPPQSQYPEPGDVAQLYRRVEEELGRLPSVVSVGATSASPLFGGRELDEFTAVARPDDPVVGRWFDVSAGYFKTLDVPLRRGRHLSQDDRAGAPAVALVN
ncbi:MAG: ABC transporter permease [Acidobacteriota bacterium]